MDIHQLASSSEAFINELNKHPEITGSYKGIVDELLRTVDDAINNNKKLQVEGRLRVGIIGAVKAGKSTLLNALLFDGKEILPKAATPMTAALTRIQYDEKPSIELEFYSEEDWKIIEAQADAYKKEETKLKNSLSNSEIQTNIKSEIRKILGDIVVGSHELCQFSEDAGINVPNYLGKTKAFKFDTVEEMEGKLNEYVATGGHFTSITKSCTVKVNHDWMKEIEIVDTPGLNDPIISRVMVTDSFLGQCHAVVFLSVAEQFWSSDDKSYLIHKIQGKEDIKYIYVLASRFDEIISGTIEDYDTIEDCLEGALQPMQGKIVKDEDLQDFQCDVIPVSPVFSVIAHKKENDVVLTELELEIQENFESALGDYTINPELCETIGNIKPLKDVFEQLKVEKNTILEQKIKDFLPTQQKQIQELQQTIIDSIQKDFNRINKGDVKELRKEISNAKRTTKNLRSKLIGVLSKWQSNYDKILSECSEYIFERENEAGTLKITPLKVGEKTDIKIEVEYKQPGFWKNLITFGKAQPQRIEHRTPITIDIYKPGVQRVQVGNQLSRFTEEIDSFVKKKIGEITDIQNVSLELRNVVEPLVDNFEDFDIELILTPLDIILRELNKPLPPLRPLDYQKNILSKFCRQEITGDDALSQLQELLINTIQALSQDVKQKLDSFKEDKLNAFKNTIDSLEDNICASIDEHRISLEGKFKNKVESCNQYQELFVKVNI